MSQDLKDLTRAGTELAGVVGVGALLCLCLWFFTGYKMEMYWGEVFRPSSVVPWQLVVITVVSAIGVLLPRYGQLDVKGSKGFKFFMYGCISLGCLAAIRTTSIVSAMMFIGTVAYIYILIAIFHFWASIVERSMEKLQKKSGKIPHRSAGWDDLKFDKEGNLIPTEYYKNSYFTSLLQADDPMVKAVTDSIKLALNFVSEEGIDYLRACMNGDYKEFRKEWPKAPKNLDLLFSVSTTNSHDVLPAMNTIEFAINPNTSDGYVFLMWWVLGDFDKCRKVWPHAPKECFSFLNTKYK